MGRRDGKLKDPIVELEGEGQSGRNIFLPTSLNSEFQITREINILQMDINKYIGQYTKRRKHD